MLKAQRGLGAAVLEPWRHGASQAAKQCMLHPHQSSLMQKSYQHLGLRWILHGLVSCCSSEPW